MYYGLIVAIPTVIISGVLLTKITLTSSEKKTKQKNELSFDNTDSSISFSISIFILLLPVILITIPQLIISMISLPKTVNSYLKLISNPISALIITLIIAIVRLGIMRGQKISQISNDLTLSAKSIATVLLINGAAGGLKQILIDAKVTEEIVSITSKLNISVLLISFVVAAILRITLGSSTVSAITTLAIVEPMINSINYPATLVMLSIAAGSMFCSHVNDPGF